MSCSASRGHVLIARPARTCIHILYIHTMHTLVEYIPIPSAPPSDLKTGDRLRSKRGTVAGVQGEGEDTAAAPYYKADYLDGLDVFVQPSAIHTHVGTRSPWTPACVCVCAENKKVVGSPPGTDDGAERWKVGWVTLRTDRGVGCTGRETVAGQGRERRDVARQK